MLCLVGSVSRAQDTANGEKGYKAKCAGCHGANAAAVFVRMGAGSGAPS